MKTPLPNEDIEREIDKQLQELRLPLLGAEWLVHLVRSSDTCPPGRISKGYLYFCVIVGGEDQGAQTKSRRSRPKVKKPILGFFILFQTIVRGLPRPCPLEKSEVPTGCSIGVYKNIAI